MQGTQLGRYALLAELGSGGMGTVWRAADADGAVVALKVVHEHVAATPGFLERFVREGEVGLRVRHENVVATLGTGESDGRHWIALEYVEGQTLRGLREEMGTVPEELCRHVGREMAKGLGALHAAGLVHRDVKPENVLITRDHVVKVMDLGIARGASDDQRMTATGMFVGSVQYAAPEQFTGGGKGLDPRADLWSLGVTLYELATGTQPFEGADVSETLRNVLHTTPRRAGEANPQLSAFFEELLRTLLERERDRRFASAADLLDALTLGEDSTWWHERAKAIRAATRKPLRRIRIPRETALYGREAELAKLHAAFDRAAAGEGAILLVEGEAGIGKSRLLDEYVALLHQQGHDLNFLWGSTPPGGAATASGAFSTAWREHFGNDDAALAAALPEQPLLVPAFAALLRGDAPPKGAEPLTKDSLQTVFVRSAQTLAKERVTIVLVEDLHFAPDEGRALFASLAMATPGHRILLVGTTRPGLDEKWTANLLRVGAEKLVVPRLGPADLVKLLTDSLRSEHLATDLAGQIALKSDGNPFFVFEILRGLREGLFLTRRDDGTWATTKRIGEIEIPPSIAELIQARVSDLGDDDRNLLEVAACVGFEFDPGLVGAVLGIAPIPTLQRLGAIEKRSRLVRASGKRFVFDHHQVQEHLYAGISEGLREQYHGAIGEALESRSGVAAREPGDVDGPLCVELVRHLLAGGLGTRALRYLDRAMQALESSARHRAAADVAGAVLGTPGLVEGDGRVDLFLRRAERLDFAGMGAAQREALDEACALAGRPCVPRTRIRALRARGWYLASLPDLPAAARDLQEAIEEARAAGDRQQEAIALGEFGSALWNAGRIDEAERHARLQLQVAESCGSQSIAGAAHGLLGNVAQSRGDLQATLLHQTRAAELSRVDGGRREAIHVANLGNALSALGREEEARECQVRALALARRAGDRRSETYALANLGSLESVRDPEEAIRLFGEAARGAAELGMRRGECIVRMNLANSLVDVGRVTEADEIHAASCAIAADLGDPYAIAFTHGNRGVALLALGRPADARAPLDASIAAAGKLGNEVLRGTFLRHRSEARHELGDADGARADLEESIHTLRAVGLHSSLASVLVERASRRIGVAPVDLLLADVGEAALTYEREQNVVGMVHVDAFRARLGVGDPGDVARRIAALGDRMSISSRMQARLWLWQGARDRTHLHEAKRLLDELLAKNPPEFHESMLTNVRVNREIVAASRAEGIG